jgi:hypothetical protein
VTVLVGREHELAAVEDLLGNTEPSLAAERLGDRRKKLRR